jgi:fructose-1-phosphate kinase PfkB-like protein
VEEDTGRVTELVEEAAPPSSAEWGRLDEAIRSALPGCSWLALSGALPPGAPADMLARICALAGAGGLKLCVDSQGEPLLGCLKDKPALVKLNAEELARTLGLDDPTPAALTGAARRLRDLGAATVFVTDGDRPARLFTEEAEQAFSIPRVSVVNPIGSGDCVTAGLLHALREGRPLPEAARFGLACGSANAETDVPALFDPARVRALTSA